MNREQKEKALAIVFLIGILAAIAVAVWVVIIVWGWIVAGFQSWSADYNDRKQFYANHCKIVEKGSSTSSWGIVNGNYAYISTDGKTKFQCDDGTTYIEDAGLYE